MARKKRKKVNNRNPIAKEVTKLRPLVVPNKKLYKRKSKHDNQRSKSSEV